MVMFTCLCLSAEKVFIETYKAVGSTFAADLEFFFTTCLDTRQPGTVFKKLDTRQSEILTNFLEIARLIPLRT